MSVENIIIRKKNTNVIIRKKISIKTPQSNQDTNSDLNQLPQIDTDHDFMRNYLETVVTDPKSSLSKENLIEKVEYQRDLLVKNRMKYRENDYLLKMEAIDKIFSRLRLGLTFDNLNELKDLRQKIDKIVLNNKIQEKEFIEKIDLTGICDEPDPSYQIMTNGRQFFAKNKYQVQPPEIVKIDPKNHDGGYGNKPMPIELLKQINFY